MNKIEAAYYFSSIVVAVATVITLFLTACWRHCDNAGKIITYIKCIDELMWLVVENTGNNGLEIQNIDISEATFCGTDIKENIYQCKTWLEPKGQLRYLLGRAYIHDGGIKIKGSIKCTHKKYKIDIEFKETKAWCNSCTIEEELMILHHDMKKINKNIEQLKEQRIKYNSNSCDIKITIENKEYYIPKEMIFNFLDLSDTSYKEKINTKNFMDDSNTYTLGKPVDTSHIEFYCIDNNDIILALRVLERNRKVKDIILNGKNNDINTSEAFISFGKCTYRIDTVEKAKPCRNGVYNVYYVRLAVSNEENKHE